MIGSIAFQAVPIRIANVHRHANDRIVVLRSVPRECLQRRCQNLKHARASHLRRLRDAGTHSCFGPVTSPLASLPRVSNESELASRSLYS